MGTKGRGSCRGRGKGRKKAGNESNTCVAGVVAVACIVGVLKVG